MSDSESPLKARGHGWAVSIPGALVGAAIAAFIARSPGDELKAQVAHLQDQVAALSGQVNTLIGRIDEQDRAAERLRNERLVESLQRGRVP